MKVLRYWGICILFLLTWVTGIAQKKDYFEIQAIISVEDGILEGTTIDIELNGNAFQHFSANRDGKFMYRLKFNNEYKLTFAKPGFYSKIILVSTFVPQAVLDYNSDFPPIQFEVNVLKEVPDVDKSFSFKPFAKISYDRAIDDFKADIFLNENLFAAQLEEAYNKEKELDKEKKTLDKLELQELQEIQKEYDRIIKDADGFFDQLKYDEALAKYKEANKLFPDRPYPTDRILEIQNLLDAMRLAEQNKQDINRQYKDAIDRGDAKLREKVYNESLSNYRQALQLKPEDNYAMRKIEEVEKILEQQNKSEQFATIYARAEDLFNAKDYKQAREIYRQASTILPDDPRPNERINEINSILQQLAAQEASEQSYQQAIQNGDRLAGQQKYNDAIAEYRKALEIKSNDRQALEKIQNTEAIVLQLQNMQAYEAAVSEADKAFRKKDYQLARDGYEKALGLKPGEKYPQDQLNQIAAIQAAESSERLKAEQYASLVNSGDSLLNLKDYKNARELFVKASDIKPNENYPGQKIKEIDKILDQQLAESARIQQIEARYNQAIAKGDIAFNEKRFDVAKLAYNEALKEKPGENYPAGKIDEINRILENQAAATALEQNYQSAMREGDRLVGLQKYEDGIAEYRKALALKENDRQAQNKIFQAEDAIRTQQHIQAYESAIAEGDKAFRKKDYQLAETEYRKALAEKPEEQYPKKQLTEIANILAAENAEKQKLLQYAALVKSGDSLFTAKNYTEAKVLFVKAGNLYSQQTYPKQMIARIDKEIQDIAVKEAQQKQLDQNYTQAIARGDQAFAMKQNDIALQAYNEALDIKPNEPYPTQKIDEINRIIQAEMQNIYQQAIAEADRLFNQKNYAQAIDEYRKAIRVKTNDEYANKKISEANELMIAIAAENARLKKLDDDYNRLLSQAADAAQRNDLQKEKEKLSEALNLKPNESYPQNRISEIDSILEKQRIAEENSRLYAENMKAGQKAFNDDQLSTAKNYFIDALKYKPEDVAALQRTAEIEQILTQRAEIERLTKLEEEQRIAAEKANKEKYDREIADADADFGLKRYNEARAHYVIAMSAMPGEQHAKNRIKEIDNLLDEMKLQAETMKQKAIRDSIDRANEQQYQLLLNQAETFASAKKYEDAIAKFYDAIDVMPSKRNEINNIIAELKEQMRIANKIMADYQSTIARADELFDSGKYDEALAFYIDASNLMPDMDYPKNRIAEIQKMENTRNEKYLTLIAKADELFKLEKWQSSKNSYIEALDVIPDDEYAKKQLQVINQKITLLLAADVEKSLTAKAFDDMVKQAEELYNSGQLYKARNMFEIAKTIKPDEVYPEKKITEIDLKIEEFRKDSLLMAKNNEENDRYQNIISLADQAYRKKTYPQAISKYQEALEIKPNESYPKNQIELINQLIPTARKEETPAVNPSEETVALAETFKQDDTSGEYMETSPRYLENLNITETNKLYDEIIKKADDIFAKKDYSVSRFFYYKASDIKPAEAYPKQRIEEIGRLIDLGLSEEIVSAYDSNVKLADDAFSKNNYTVAKFYYYKALEYKSWERYPKDRIHEIQVLTNSLLSEREEKMYNEAIASADEAYYAKNYSVARFHYNQAAKINPQERYPKIKLEDIRKLIEQEKQDQIRMEYMNQLQQADQAFEQGNYGVARFYYNKALTILKNEQYPKDQLKRIEELLAKKKE